MSPPVAAGAHHAGSAWIGSRRAHLLVGAFVGLVSGVAVFGPGFLWGDPDAWRYLWGDAGSGLAAFRYYVAEGWGFPLLEARGLNQPDGINVAFTDSLPVLALVAKALAPLGIPAAAWWGWWYVGLHVAQGASAAWAARAWGNRSLPVAASVATIAVSAPILLLRTWHPGLAGQFLLLAAWAWVGELRAGGDLAPGPEDARLRAVASSGAVLAVLALLVHVYLLLGVLVVVTGGVLDLVAQRRWRPCEALVWSGSVAGALLVVGAVLGYFTAGAAEAPGYDTVGMHLFGPVVAQQSTFWPGNEWTIEASGSFEAFNWLGFGWLALVAVATGLAVVTRGRDVVVDIRRHQVLVAALVVLAAYSITPVVRLWDDDPHDLRTPLGWLVEDRSLHRPIWGVGLLAVVAGAVLLGRRRLERTWWPGASLLGLAIAVLAVSLLGSMALVDAVTGQFRSAGRMFWALSYGTLALAGGQIGGRLRSPAGDGRLRVLLVATVVTCAVGQVVDVSAWRNLAATTLDPTDARRERLDAIAEVLDGADGLVIEPSFTCAEGYAGAEGLWTFQDVGMVASWDRLPTNRAYGARQAYERCDVVEAPTLDEGEVFVLVAPPEIAETLVELDPAWACRRAGLVLACR